MRDYNSKSPIRSSQFLVEENVFSRRGLMNSSSDYFLRSKQNFISMDAAQSGDASSKTSQEKNALERHFNDVYAVFLNNLTEFAITPSVAEEDIQRLRSFFEELLRVRKILEEQQ